MNDARKWYCLECKTVGDEKCPKPECIMGLSVRLTRTPETLSGKFVHWFLKIDVIFYMSLIAGTLLNAMIANHLGLDFQEAVIDGVCAGVLLVGLLRK
jgi:hypothetical protein